MEMLAHPVMVFSQVKPFFYLKEIVHDEYRDISGIRTEEENLETGNINTSYHTCGEWKGRF